MLRRRAHRYRDEVATRARQQAARLRARLGRRRQELRLVVPASSPLTRVLTLTHVDSVAAIHETLDAALGQ